LFLLFQLTDGVAGINVQQGQFEAVYGVVFYLYLYQYMHVIAKTLSGGGFEVPDAVTAVSPCGSGDFGGQLVGTGIFLNQVKVVVTFGRIEGVAGDVGHDPAALTGEGVFDGALDVGSEL
jgi:hypothetical protein